MKKNNHNRFSGKTKLRFLSFAVTLLLSTSLIADNIITSGTTLRVTAGATLVSTSAITIQNGATLNNLGTVLLSGNLTNQNVAASNLGAGTFSMSGTSLQIITGQNVFSNLTLNNAAGVNLNGNTTVNGTFTFTNGSLHLLNHNLTMGTASTVAGTPSATSLVAVTGSGQLRKSFSAAGNFSFPVGDNIGTAEYSPVTVNFTGGSFGTDNYVGVNLTNTAYPGSTGSYINRYWNITQSGISGFTCNATFKYMPADVIGTESSIYCVRVLPEPQTNFQVANTTLDQLTANGLTEFGTFTGKLQVINKTLNLTLMLEGLFNILTSQMNKAQNASGNQYAGSVADQVTIELRQSTTPYTLVQSFSNIDLPANGICILNIPAALSSSYYLVVKHRNSVTTWSASALSFGSSTINYDFTNAANKAYGNNLKLIGTKYCIYGGDVNQDGILNTSDLNTIYTSASTFSTGYIVNDCNGDGLVDAADLIMADNNSSLFIVSMHP